MGAPFKSNIVCSSQTKCTQESKSEVQRQIAVLGAERERWEMEAGVIWMGYLRA